MRGGPGAPQQAGGTSKAGRPTAAACRSGSLLQFVIIIKGLTPEASLPLFAPPALPRTAQHGAPLKSNSSYGGWRREEEGRGGGDTEIFLVGGCGGFAGFFTVRALFLSL